MEVCGRLLANSVDLMKTHFLRNIVGAGAVFLAISVAGAQEILGGAAAFVNDDVITVLQMRMVTAPKEKAAREQFKGIELAEKIKEIKAATLEELIDRQLILQEYKKLCEKGNRIPGAAMNDRVDAKIAEIVEKEFGGDRSALQRHLTANGDTMDQFRTEQTCSIIVECMRKQTYAKKAEGSANAEQEHEQAIQKWIASLRKKAFIRRNDLGFEK